jgi:hypothetical protein
MVLFICILNLKLKIMSWIENPNKQNDIRSNTASSGNTTIDLTTLESYGQHELSKLDTIMQTLGHIKTQMNTSTQNQVSIYDQLVLLTQKQASNDHMIRILNHLSLKITGTEVEWWLFLLLLHLLHLLLLLKL